MPVNPNRPTIEDMLAKDFDVFDEEKTRKLNKEDAEAVEQKKRKRANLYFDCFNTPAGKKVLDDLVKRYIVATRWNGTLNLLDAIPDGFMHEGQQQVVHWILNQVKHAMDGDDKGGK